jgi:hypothetical protein
VIITFDKPSLYLNCLLISSLLCPNILLSCIFSNTSNLYSYFNIRDRVSQPYKTNGRNSKPLYIVLERRRDNDSLCFSSYCHQGRHFYWLLSFTDQCELLCLMTVLCSYVWGSVVAYCRQFVQNTGHGKPIQP